MDWLAARGIIWMSAIPKYKPWRSAKYLKWVRSLPCEVCGTDQDIQAHHAIGQGHGIMGGKQSDYHAFALCPLCHRRLHDMGVMTWESIYGTQREYVSGTIHRAIDAGVLKA